MKAEKKSRKILTQMKEVMGKAILVAKEVRDLPKLVFSIFAGVALVILSSGITNYLNIKAYTEFYEVQAANPIHQIEESSSE